MNNKIIFGILFILLFSFGCTAPVYQEGGDNEKIQEIYEVDLNKDGIADTTTYVFQKQEYNETDLQRIMIVKPQFDLSKLEIEITEVGDKYYFENLSITELKFYLNNFDNKRSNEVAVTGEAQCKQYLGLNREDLPCISTDTCAKSCIGAPLCKSIYQYVGEPFAQDLYELNNGFNKMNTYIYELEVLFNEMEGTEKDLEKQKLEQVIEKIEQMYMLGKQINQNPIINKQVYYLCNNINYDNTELQNILDKISENLKTETFGQTTNTNIEKTNMPIESVKYDVYLQINEKSNRSFSSIRIIDMIPEELNINSSTLKVSSNFSTINTTIPSVEWKINKAGGGNIQSFMTYSFESEKLVNKTWLENNIKTPLISVESFSMGGTPLTTGFFGYINIIFSFFFNFSNYFIALALTGALIIIILRLFELLISLIWNLILGTSKRQNFLTIKKNWLGKANPKYRQYLLLGGILVLSGMIITFIYPSQIQDNIIILEMVGHNIMLEPILGFSSILILLGIVSLYFGTEELIKGTILQSGYYESAEKIAKKSNIDDLQKLEESMKAVEDRIKGALELKIDVSEEQELLYSIPISRIKELIEKNDQRTAKKVIEQSINRCEFNIGTIDKKIQTATDIWENWNNKFDKLLKEKGEIRKEMLVDIPRTWRAWALEKYLIENLDKDLIIETGILKKMEIKRVKKKGITEILENIINENKEILNAAIVRIDGKVMASALNKNSNASLISLMISRMIKSIKIIETRAKTGDTEYLVARAGKELFFIKPIGDLILVYITTSKTSLNLLTEITEKYEKDITNL